VGPFNFEPIDPITTLQPAFDKDFGPEQYMTLQQIFHTPLGDIAWNKFVQNFPDKPATGDFMDLNVILRFGPKANTDNYVSYLFTKVYTEKAQKALIAFGSDDAGKIWLNGKLIHSIWALRGTKLGDDMVAASLEKGWNTVLVKHVNMRLGAGIAFDIKAYSEDNVKVYNGDTSRARFAELPSLPLRYDAYALDNVTVPAVMILEENGQRKALSGKLEGSGISQILLKDGPFAGKNAFKVDFTSAARQVVSAFYDRWEKSGGLFEKGVFEMSFFVPVGASAPHITLTCRNAGGYNPGDVEIYLMGGKDVRNALGAKPVPFKTLRFTADTDAKLMGAQNYQKDIPLDSALPGGFKEGQWYTMKITWGGLKDGKGLVLSLNGCDIIKDESFKGKLFSSPEPITLCTETYCNEEGEITFTGASLKDSI
jgi:hypothetical protein